MTDAEGAGVDARATQETQRMTPEQIEAMKRQAEKESRLERVRSAESSDDWVALARDAAKESKQEAKRNVDDRLQGARQRTKALERDLKGFLRREGHLGTVEEQTQAIFQEADTEVEGLIGSLDDLFPSGKAAERASEEAEGEVIELGLEDIEIIEAPTSEFLEKSFELAEENGKEVKYDFQKALYQRKESIDSLLEAAGDDPEKRRKALELAGVPIVEKGMDQIPEEQTLEYTLADLSSQIERIDKEIQHRQRELEDMEFESLKEGMQEKINDLLEQQSNLFYKETMLGRTQEAYYESSEQKAEISNEFGATLETINNSIDNALNEALAADPENEGLLDWKRNETNRRAKEGKIAKKQIEGHQLIAEDTSGLNRTSIVRLEGDEFPTVYKPAVGETPLLRKGFPFRKESGETWRREALAYMIDKSLGLESIPATVVRDDGPEGVGVYQEWIPSTPAGDFEDAQLGDWRESVDRSSLLRVALKDYVTNNTDGHERNFGITPDGKAVGFDNGLIEPLKTEGVDRLRSAPLKEVAGEKVPKEIRDRMQVFMQSTELQKTLKDSYVQILGEEDGFRLFDKMLERIRPIVEDPDFKLPEPDIKR